MSSKGERFKESYIPLIFGFSLLVYSLNGDMSYLKRSISSIFESILK